MLRQKQADKETRNRGRWWPLHGRTTLSPHYASAAADRTAWLDQSQYGACSKL